MKNNWGKVLFCIDFFRTFATEIKNESGQNRTHPPKRKISSTDAIKTPLLTRPAVSEGKGENQDNKIYLLTIKKRKDSGK